MVRLDEPHPSAAEDLTAEFGHVWEIWRELLAGGTHGRWFARRWDGGGPEVTAQSITELGEHLRGLSAERVSRGAAAAPDRRGNAGDSGA